MRIPKLPKIKRGTKMLLSLVVVGLFFTLLPPVGAFFLSLFLLFLAFRIDSRILGLVAIALLVSIPVLQYLEMSERAEEMAVYVYFLLVTIVTLQIVDSVKSGSHQEMGTSRDNYTEDTPSPKERVLKNTWDDDAEAYTSYIQSKPRATARQEGYYGVRRKEGSKHARVDSRGTLYERTSIEHRPLVEETREETILRHRLTKAHRYPKHDDVPEYLPLPEKLKVINAKKEEKNLIIV